MLDVWEKGGAGGRTGEGKGTNPGCALSIILRGCSLRFIKKKRLSMSIKKKGIPANNERDN